MSPAENWLVFAWIAAALGLTFFGPGGSVEDWGFGFALWFILLIPVVIPVGAVVLLIEDFFRD